MRLVVVGAGVFGLSTAVLCAARGAQVTVHDDGPADDSASAVAAGMLAPAFECMDGECMDAASAGHFSLYREARDLWPAFLDTLGAARTLVDRSGALRVFGRTEAIDAGGLAHGLAAAGAQAEVLTGAQARRLQPLLTPAVSSAVHTCEDWRLDPIVVLAAMRAALQRYGGSLVGAHAGAAAGGPQADGRMLAADALVLAGGAASAGWSGFARELSVLRPIKGQIVHYDRAAPLAGPVVRTAGAYLAPQARGVIAGATMEYGAADRRIDPATVASLADEAAGWFPHLARAPWRGLAGVRAATPDGLPLAGRGQAGGFIATGARRNGWLLAPMVAKGLAALLAGEGPGAAFARFDPQRFAPQRLAPQRLAPAADGAEQRSEEAASHP